MQTTLPQLIFDDLITNQIASTYKLQEYFFKLPIPI
jgi:hypothetical protein